jgi:hypothetical protein
MGVPDGTPAFFVFCDDGGKFAPKAPHGARGSRWVATQPMGVAAACLRWGARGSRGVTLRARGSRGSRCVLASSRREGVTQRARGSRGLRWVLAV